MEIKEFLPVCRADMDKLGWERLDFIIVSGDAYVDHPSFGTAIISRVLTDAGYKVGIIAQPDWKNHDDIKRLGRPRLAFLITSGNIDPMVNHYTVSKIRRTTDNYSPGGEMGLRPDRADIVYTNLVRQAFKKAPIILGGVEASLRRFAHYDYWDNKVRRSILADSEADLLVYGMGEHQIVEIASYLNDGVDISYIHHIPGTCYMTDTVENVYEPVEIPSFEEIAEDKHAYAKAFKIQYDEQDPIRGATLVQKHKDKYLVQNPPAMPLEREELDRVYNMFYMRDVHPSYREKGGVPAIREVKFSITSERGCFGACSFCAITSHQGRIVTSRSHESITDEAFIFTNDSEFKGYIHDVGGPTANFRHASCDKMLKLGSCKDRQCLYPSPCKNLRIDHEDYIELLRKLRKVDKVKKVFVRSGIRYDYLLADEKPKCAGFLDELVQNHVSGQLKVAPEHIDDTVLHMMGKPAGKTYKKFMDMYFEANDRAGKEQYLVPYLMSSHPGSTLESAIHLAEFLRDIGYQPEQVQDFYPTPGTLSTTMYYTGLDPRTSSDPRKMKEVYIPKTKEEKALQRALLQFRKKENKKKVYDALMRAGRKDLIGFGKNCLITPLEPGDSRRDGSGSPSRKPGNGRPNDRARSGGASHKPWGKPKGSSFRGDR